MKLSKRFVSNRCLMCRIYFGFCFVYFQEDKPDSGRPSLYRQQNVINSDKSLGKLYFPLLITITYCKPTLVLLTPVPVAKHFSTGFCLFLCLPPHKFFVVPGSCLNLWFNLKPSCDAFDFVSFSPGLLICDWAASKRCFCPACFSVDLPGSWLRVFISSHIVEFLLH